MDKTMKEIIPCNINEKDLCSDVLFEDLFDNNEYVSNEKGTLVGFMDGEVVKADYIPNTSTIMLCGESLNKERIKAWLEDLKEGMNNSLGSNSEYTFDYMMIIESTERYYVLFRYIKK